MGIYVLAKTRGADIEVLAFRTLEEARRKLTTLAQATMSRVVSKTNDYLELAEDDECGLDTNEHIYYSIEKTELA